MEKRAQVLSFLSTTAFTTLTLSKPVLQIEKGILKSKVLAIHHLLLHYMYSSKQEFWNPGFLFAIFSMYKSHSKCTSNLKRNASSFPEIVS